MENSLIMTKLKSKSVIIDGEVHSRFKEHCKTRDLKIGKVLEKLIEVYLNDTQEIQGLINRFNESK